MGQYYSNRATEEQRDTTERDLGSVGSSPRSSSDEWRMSMSSTVTSSSAAADSDDTLGREMGELSSLNSRLSSLDEVLDEKTKKRLNSSNKSFEVKGLTTSETENGADFQFSRPAMSIKSAIDELESIEKAAQSLLLTKPENEKRRPGTDLNVEIHECEVRTTQRSAPVPPPRSKRCSDPKESAVPVQLGSDGVAVENPENVTDKPPLPPLPLNLQSPKLEAKRRWWTRPKEMQPYISRESYDNDKLCRELEKLKKSYKERDLNQFLDTLESTVVPDDADEEFYEKLLFEIKDDLEEANGTSSSVSTEGESPSRGVESRPCHSPLQRAAVSSRTRKFEKVKERILELLQRKKTKEKGGEEENSSVVSKEGEMAPTPQLSGRATPQSSRPQSPDSLGSRPQSPEDAKKGFGIAEFFRKGSPKFLRKKYKEMKKRKSDAATSESECEEAEMQRETGGKMHSVSDGKIEDMRELNEMKDKVAAIQLEVSEKDNGNYFSEGASVLSQEETKEMSSLDEKTQGPVTGFSMPSESLLSKLPERMKPSRKKKRSELSEVSGLPGGEDLGISANSELEEEKSSSLVQFYQEAMREIPSQISEEQNVLKDVNATGRFVCRDEVSKDEKVLPEDSVDTEPLDEHEVTYGKFPCEDDTEDAAASFYDNVNPYAQAVSDLEKEVFRFETAVQNTTSCVAAHGDSTGPQDPISKDHYKRNEKDRRQGLNERRDAVESREGSSFLRLLELGDNVKGSQGSKDRKDEGCGSTSPVAAQVKSLSESGGTAEEVSSALTDEMEATVSDLTLTQESSFTQSIKGCGCTADFVVHSSADTVGYSEMPRTGRVSSNTIGVQTDAREPVRRQEAASQTDTEYEETDLETESEFDDWVGKKEGNGCSRGFFHPSVMKGHQVPRNAESSVVSPDVHPGAVVPPQHFQRKMPPVVIKELKTVLADPPLSLLPKEKVEEDIKEVDRSWEKALQSLGLDETSLLDEIEQILAHGTCGGGGPLRRAATADRQERDGNGNCACSEDRVRQEIWSPGKERSEKGGPTRLENPDLPSFKEVPPVWTPNRGGSESPSLERKEYKKVKYEGSGGGGGGCPGRTSSREKLASPKPEESFAWRDSKVEELFRTSSSSLPRVQSPTVTLLQKKREGKIPGSRPEYLKADDEVPHCKPDDKLYTIKKEYESDEDDGRRFAILTPKKVDGVGPTTTNGLPTTLKSSVKSEHQGEWYRRMFDSLHKVRDDSGRCKFSSNKARYGGYMSEPEGYDSDVGYSRYATLDRRRMNTFDYDPVDFGSYRNVNRYVHQPGRIEDYVPGYSSLSERELKATLDAHSGSANQRPVWNDAQMTHNLKESGYESDSTLIFRKRDDRRYNCQDPRKNTHIYRQIQKGGEIPLKGLQRPAPQRPKESGHRYEDSEVNIHYRTPIRLEQKEHISDEELARRQEEHMRRVYEQERRKKYLSELEDIEKRRHADNFTPQQKSPIPLNRYDDEAYGGRGVRTPEPRQLAKALYNFHAQNKRELSFVKGDLVVVRRQIDKNWFEGELRGHVGIFPCNYVEILLETHRSKRPTEGQARARFNFRAQTPMEITLSKGEYVVLTRRVDDNWYEGRTGNRRGIFPVSYVDVLMEPGHDRPGTPGNEPMPRPALPSAALLNGISSVSSPSSTVERNRSHEETRPFMQSLTINTNQEPVAYKALYSYKPQNDDELELLEGDVVLVMEKCDDGWFVGTSRRTGLFGTFPGNYVEKA